MSAECFLIRVPEGRKLTGFTATGQRVPILPGEYHVHRLVPKPLLPGGGAALRFVGAHGGDSDVHIRLPDGVEPGDVIAQLESLSAVPERRSKALRPGAAAGRPGASAPSAP